MNPTSAARPSDLEAYARSGESAVARLLAEARGLEAALSVFHSRCTEYAVSETGSLVGRTALCGRHEGELAGWVGEVARGFRLADIGPRPVPLGPLRPTPHQLAEQAASRRWNQDTRVLIQLARISRLLIGPHALSIALLMPGLTALLASAVALCGADILDLIVDGDASRRAGYPVINRANLLSLLFQGFWYESMDHVDPELFRELTTEIDALNLQQAMLRGVADGASRSDDQLEPVIDPATGALGVSAGQVFPLSIRDRDGSLAPFAPLVADSMDPVHGGISYFPGEQVRLERLNAATGDYRISIAGLDPAKPAAPNNFTAVALTSQGVAEGNPYFEHVKGRVLADLERIPPGSTLHLEGHSMGGGMCFLLRGDPEVQQALVAAGVTVASVITFGAVRPRGEAGRPEDDPASPFAGAEERHYVNTDDSLALNVGAGHASDPAVILLDNEKIDDPTVAHTDYNNLEHYDDLPAQLQTMPYVVDPASYEVYLPALPDVPVLPTPAP